MPTTLITGGGGFLGSRLTALLQSCGEKIVLLDRQFVPAALTVLAPGYETIEGDVRDACRSRIFEYLGTTGNSLRVFCLWGGQEQPQRVP